jgi:hypothetical protein
MLRWKSKVVQVAKVRKVLFAEKRKERPHGVMHHDPQNSGLLSQVVNQVL